MVRRCYDLPDVQTLFVVGHEEVVLALVPVETPHASLVTHVRELRALLQMPTMDAFCTADGSFIEKRSISLMSWTEMCRSMELVA